MFKFYCFLFLVIVNLSLAQKETNNWLFGYGAGLNFNTGTPVSFTGGQLSSVECSASVSDRGCSGHIVYPVIVYHYDKN